MGFKPNYGQQRGDRNRAKEQKKQEKLQRKEENAARRRAEDDQLQDTDGGTSPETPMESTDGPQEAESR